MLLRHHHPFLDPHRENRFVAFAHRGGFSDLAENSLRAFRSAVTLGYRYLETDVQITRDGHLVAFHDTNLARTCQVPRDIDTLTRQELSQLRIGGTDPIPLLAELFEEFPDIRINLDAKTDAVVEPLIEFLERTNSLERVCIGSFEHRRLVKFRRRFGVSVCTSASPLEVAKWWAGFTPQGPSCLQIPRRLGAIGLLSESRIRRSIDQGVPIHVWTVDRELEIQELLDLGVHGIMTDDARALKRIAERNLVWS